MIAAHILFSELIPRRKSSSDAENEQKKNLIRILEVSIERRNELKLLEKNRIEVHNTIRPEIKKISIRFS